MKVDAYNFFFHPLHTDHSNEVKGLSVVTNIILTALTNGLYLLVLGAVHMREWVMGQGDSATDAKAKKAFDKVFPPGTLADPANDIFVGLHALKKKQKEHLAKLERFASIGAWKHLQRHTANPDSGFDWWMFPTTRPSSTHGKKYALSPRYIQALQNDPAFMASYRKGVILVAKSWGWDLLNDRDLDNPALKWDDYPVRLGKMLQSLTEFGQKDLHDTLVDFIVEHRISLPSWVKNYMKPIPHSAAFVS